jgi:hypothetical protein
MLVDIVAMHASCDHILHLFTSSIQARAPEAVPGVPVGEPDVTG